MNNGLISRRYAKALLEYAVELKQDAAVYGLMKRLHAVLFDHAELRHALESPVNLATDKVMWLRESVDNPPVESFDRFAAMVIAQRREKSLLNITLSYMELYRQSNNITVVHIVTAVEPESDIIERIGRDVAESTHGSVEFDLRVDPAIEGGFILQIDDKRMDASVTGALNRIRNQFIEKNKTIV